MFDNIVLISIDTLRYDCVNCQKKKRIEKKLIDKFLKTPTLNSLIKNSICFTNAFSTSVFTPPAHASLFTGKYPPEHNIREFYYNREKLNNKTKTLAEYFVKNNYRTLAHSDFYDLFNSLDLLRGFENISSMDSDFFNKFNAIKQHRKKFIFLHFFDIHKPYLFSPSDMVNNEDYYKKLGDIIKSNNKKNNSIFWNRKPYVLWNKVESILKKSNYREKSLQLYLQGVSKFDKGRFKTYINFLQNNLSKKSLFIILSDHGEGVGSLEDEKSFQHGPLLANEVLRIPVIFYSNKFKHAINNNLFSIKDIYQLIIFLSKNKSEKYIKNYRNSNNFIYAESYNYGIKSYYSKEKGRPNNFFQHLKQRSKKDYYLFERCLIDNNFKFILSFKPEIFIPKINSLKINKKTIKWLFNNLFKDNPLPSRFYIFMLYFINKFVPSGKNIVFKILFNRAKYPIIRYVKFRNTLKIKCNYLKMIQNIFKINKLSINIKNIQLFLGMINIVKKNNDYKN